MIIDRARALVGRFSGLFSLRFDRAPIATAEAMHHFVASRSAFVSQKKLYGYLKARMGTRYPLLFEDAVFMDSVNVAKVHVFAAALSDLTIHTVARVAVVGGLTHEESARLARQCRLAGLADNEQQLSDMDARAAWEKAFEARLAGVHWENMAAGGDAFTESPAALFQWAPIADELKKLDREIVENSIRFAYGEVTRDFRRRADVGAIARDWRGEGGAEAGVFAG
ncbi:hypothetical protein [Nitratireductor soli]|uniref:hypothetical protein n=1 Tax=Nitratireductor soli TaxID=1670619 RepID=UPI00065E0398|nr:hypothetical protein [Nitratireductor soli]